MKILSLFDGISSGRIAFERAGISIEKYYASEINRYAEIISEANYPDIIRLGDVTKWREWNIDRPDLICAGSPCQGFSMAGKHKNFSDSRSILFFDFMEIINHYKPKYFLLENVKMKKEHQDIISRLIGCEPIEINSALLSAQNRKRNYWTNIPGVEQPEDSNIFLKHIVYQRDHGFNKGGFKMHKAPTLTTSSWEHNNFIFQHAHGNTPFGIFEKEKSPCLTCSFSRNIYKYSGNPACIEKYKDYSYRELKDAGLIRKFTPIEAELLQTLPDNYTNYVSDTQRYKAIGNGWTIDVIAHILRNLQPFLNI